MNSILFASIRESDGRFLSDAELYPWEQFVHSFSVRYNTYVLLKDEGPSLVLQSLRRLVQTPHRKTIQEHGAKCQRDMLYTLECMAKAILLDDHQGFVDEYLMWMQNITRALHKQHSAVDAYRVLKAEINSRFPQECVQVVNPYLDKVIEAFANGM